MKTTLALAVCILAVSLASADTQPQILYSYSKNLSPSTVEFHAGIRGNGAPFTAWFRISMFHGFTDYEYNTVPQEYPADTGTVEITQTFSGLPTDTIYNFSYWVVANAGSEYVWGMSQGSSTTDTVTTPKLITLKPENDGLQTVNISAICNTHGVPATIYFSWSTQELVYDGWNTPSVQVTSTTDTLITATFTGLVPAVRYFMQVHALNVNEPAVGTRGEYDSIRTTPDSNAQGLSVPIVMFTSNGFIWTALNFGVHTYASNCLDVALGEAELPPYAPGIDERFINTHPSLSYCNGLGTYVDLRQYVSPTQIDTYRVRVVAEPEYYPINYIWPSLDSAYSGPVTMLVGSDLIDMKAVNTYQITDPDVAALRIIAQGPRTGVHCPMVLLRRSDFLDSSSVQLNAAVNPNGLPTSVWFEWGATTAYGMHTDPIVLDPNLGLASLTTLAGQLATNTLYHFRVNTSNLHGSWKGADGAFLIVAPSGVKPDPRAVPRSFRLDQNFPNPFNPTTRLSYFLPSRSHVMLTIYNLLGERVATLVNAIQEPGEKKITFDGSSLASGVYLYRLTTGTFSEVRKMLLMR